MEVVCYGYMSPACFNYLGHCGLKVKGKQFLDQLTVSEDTDWTDWTFHSFSSSVGKLHLLAMALR